MSRSTSRFLAALIVAGGLMIGLSDQRAHAQSDRNAAELRLYIQQLEEQVRQLTGQVEQLQFQLRQAQGPGGTVTGGAIAPVDNSSNLAGAPATNLGNLSIAADDPLIAPDGAVADAFTGNLAGQQQSPDGWTPQGTQPQAQAPTGFPSQPGGAPLDLSALASGNSNALSGNLAPQDNTSGLAAPLGSGQGAAGQGQGAPGQGAPGQVAALGGGDPLSDYDVAYGFVLNGNYPQAEQQFATWLGQYGGHERTHDASFWLAESQLQQGKSREAATGFLEIYRNAPDARKAPDSLMKLGVALAALGERDAACATFAEVGTKYPNADPSLKERTSSEATRAGC